MDGRSADTKVDVDAKKKKTEESNERQQEIQGLENHSSLKSLGAIVFNSGTLATNVAVIKTNRGLVNRLAIAAVVINCLAIFASTVLVSYGKPTRIRNLPTAERGAVALIFSFLFSVFRFSDDRSKKRDNSKTTDDRIDELDSDLIALKEDIVSLQSYVSFDDKVRLQMVWELLEKVSFNQLSNQPTKEQESLNSDASIRYPEWQGDGAASSASLPVVQETGNGSTSTKKPGTKSVRPRKGVRPEDAAIRCKLLCPDFIAALQLAKRVIGDLEEVPPGEENATRTMTMEEIALFVRITGEAKPPDEFTKQGSKLSRATTRTDRGLMGTATNRVPPKSTCSWACMDTLFQGSILRLSACCGLLREDPYIDEDFWLKRKRVNLNITLIDSVRKDLAARLTESSTGWTYPLWVNQLNLVSTMLGLGVLILDIVVATYAGNKPSLV